MNRTYVLGVAGLLVLAGCGGDGLSEQNERYAAAVCADLRDGLSVAQLASSRPSDMSPELFLGNMVLWVDHECPEQFSTNDGLRGYLEANGIDPDKPNG